ncbi:hypothetical protein ACIBHX_24835 [Nonomuraea sp. NPDC050536]|uniref:nSTAND1 domain-containing NTPase n=1 Tax=Nonomuraea sp. NPDC050536 TaxID=3364366 RepID=UPI0037C9179A
MADSSALMQAGVSSRVKRAVLEGSRRWTSPGLLAVLSAGALAPLLSSGAGEGALAVVASVGANVLTDIVKALAARLQPQREKLLEQRLQNVLESGGREAEVLRKEIADLLREFGLVGAAIEAAVSTGDRALQVALAEGLGDLGEQFKEFRFVLSDVEQQLRLIREDVDRQRADLEVAVGLQYRQATDTRLLLEKVSLLERRVVPGATRGPIWQDRSPYQGLAPYGEGDAEVFAGREVITAELVSTLSQRSSASGLLIVTGASGAGKSSLLRAGLLPAIARGDLSEAAKQWPRHVIDQPTRTPLARLALLVAGLAGLDAPTVLASFQHDPVLLVRQAVDTDARRRERHGDRDRLILILDQFEEIFADEVRPAERAAFITALSAAATDSAALVVIAVRGDFVDRCAVHPELASALREGPFVVGPMTESELRTAITAPADLAGLELEPGLVDTILADLRSAAGEYGVGALPLLSQTMLTVWSHRDDHRLTSRGYRLTGGVTQAVTTTAEAAYESLDADGRQVARQVFQQLTTVTADVLLARRTVPRAELDGEDSAAVLDVFARRRLVVVDTESAQIAHDALLRNWPRLRGWLEADLATHALRSQLLDDAEEWERHGRTPAYLYRGERLAAVQQLELPDTARGFLDASLRAEHRRKRQRRLILASLCALLVLALGAAGVALTQRGQAQEQQRVAVARLLVAQAEAYRAADPRRALQLGVAADRVHSDSQTRASLVSTLTGTRYAGTFTPSGDVSRANLVAFSPASRTLATVGSYNLRVGGTTEGRRVITLWSVPHGESPRRLGTLVIKQSGFEEVLAFSPDGRVLVTSGERDPTVTLWRVTDPGHPVPLGTYGVADTNDVQSVAYAPDGRTLAMGHEDGTVSLWNVADPAHATRIGAPLTGQKKWIQSVAFSSDGKLLAAGSDDAVTLWNVKDPARPRPLGAPLAGRWPVAFAPGRALLATHLKDPHSTNQNAFILWDLARPAAAKRIGTPLSDNNASIAFAPTGDLAATVRYDGSTALWDLADPAQPALWGTPLGGHTGFVTSVAFSADGQTLATSSADKTVILRDLTDARRPARRGRVLAGADSFAFGSGGHAFASGPTAVWDLADPDRPAVHPLDLGAGATRLSPDGRTLAVVGADATTTVWDVSDPARPRRRASLPRGTGSPFLFSPDGRLLIIGGKDKSFLWDLSDPGHPVRRGEELAPFIVLVATFSPDGRTLATTDVYDPDGTVTLWDVSGSRQPTKFVAGDAANVTSLAFAPDGRTLATGRSDGKILIWDLSTRSSPFRIGQPLVAATDPKGMIMTLGSRVSVTALAFATDGRTLAAASGTDGKSTLALWDLTNPAMAQDLGPPLPLPKGVVAWLRFSGGTLATVTFDRQATLWDLSGIIGLQRNAAQRACVVVGQGLDEAAWARYVPALPYQKTC